MLLSRSFFTNYMELRMKRRRFIIPALCALAFGMLTSVSLAQNDSVGLKKKVILWVGNFNSDFIPDTIVGIRFPNDNLMPKWINWGKITNDTTSKTTEIIYPDWKKLKGTYNIYKLDQDNLMDLIISCRGDSSSDTSVVQRAKMQVAIFAQDYIDTLKSIRLASIKNFKQFPLALEIKNDEIYKNVQISKTNGAATCMVNKIFIPTSYRKGESQTTNELKPDVKVYPNPAVQFTNLELNNMSPGKYFYEISNSIGLLLEKKELNLTSSLKIMEEINFSNFASGSYFIKLSNTEKIIGVYPFVINK